MGRPKGSKNHKRKYKKRKTDLTSLVRNASAEQIAHTHAAMLLVSDIKQTLIEAEPSAARTAINVLLSELTLIARIINGAPPAP